LNTLDAEERLCNEAVSQLRRGAKLHPDDPQGCGKLADLLCKHGNTAWEVGELRRFLARNPDDPALGAKIEQILRQQETTEPPARPATQR
jgi:hypothetical protein